jgi:hypothetical protein
LLLTFFTGEKLRSIEFLSLLAIIILIIIMVPAAYSYTTKLNINPPTTTLLAGQSFTVNVTVTSVTNLNRWQVDVSFNPMILNCTGLSVPSDSIFGSMSYLFPTPIINNTAGRVAAFCALMSSGGVSGSGRLATISFTSLTLGVSTLTFVNVMKNPDPTFSETYLFDPSHSMIPFDGNTGIVEVISSGFQRSIFSVTKNAQTYYVGILTNSTLSSFYYSGTSRELGFNITATVGTNGACIVEVDKNLLNGTLIALLSNVGLSTYARSLNTLLENATHCFAYFDFVYNTGTKNVKIRLTVTGDLNGDRRVDIKDVARVCAAFGTYPGSGRWNPVADVNHDFKVDIKDVAVVCACFGTWLQY